ncbi:MAG: leucine-rich repeat protein [Bacillota bacterium]|nr:leucine-rich repeat protein [Bacillota bacterium]
MKLKKIKAMSIIVTLVLLITSVPIFAVTAHADTINVDGLFDSGSGLYYVINNGSASVTGYRQEFRDLEIPNNLGGYPVTSIGNEAFLNYTSILRIKIPDTVTSIGANSFCNCQSLTSLTIPDSVIYIGSAAFDGCESLDNITMSNNVRSIGDHAFYNCKLLTSIIVPSGVTSIGNYVFYNCKSLTSATLPNRVTSIGDGAFYNCTSLKSLNIPSDVTSIGEDAFNNCTSLTSIIIPSNVISMGNDAFSLCTSLKDVIIQSSIENIGEDTFGFCTLLTSITIPNSVTNIDDTAFECCSPNLVIYGTTGSYAETYAQQNQISFIDKSKLNTITFNSNGGIAVANQTGVYNETITAPTTPTRDGFTFTGWYKDSDCTTMWDFSKDVVIVDTTLYAGWKCNAFIKGDVDQDEKISLKDATKIQKYLAKLESLSSDQLTAADADEDGKISLKDVTIVQKYLVKMIPNL